MDLLFFAIQIIFSVVRIILFVMQRGNKMARPRINNGKSNIGLFPETISKIQEISKALEKRDQIVRTYPALVTELVNKAYDEYVVNG